MTDPPLDPDVLDTLRDLTLPGEPDVLREVLQLFQEMMPTRLGTLQTAVAVNDFGLVERTAHAIKGSAGNIGARGLHDACSIAEHAARGHDSETVRAGVATAVCEARRVSSAISLLLT